MQVWRRPLLTGFAAALCAALVARWLLIFTEAINWDEFVMLARAEQTLRLGDVVGDGRPGLVTLMLTPLLHECVDAIDTAVRARLLWQFITLIYLGGVFFLVRNWFRFARRPESGVMEGIAAVALLAFLPAFVAWSIQVRSDQAALAASVWGGAFLLTGRWRDGVLAGMLFGVGALCTQKAIYPSALCAVLWCAAVLSRLRELPPGSRRPEVTTRLSHLTVSALCLVAIVVTYGHLVPKTASLVSAGSVVSSWEEMRWVRSRVGYRVYAAEASTALVHVALFLAFAVTSACALRRRIPDDLILLGTGWVVLFLGAAVVIIHGSGYPYFLMTVGLFPAVALGMASGHMAGFLGRHREPLVALVFFALAAGSLPVTLELARGSQGSQRDTINWIKQSGLGSRLGYQVDGALICQKGHEPLPAMLPFQIIKRAERSPKAFDDFIEEFRSRQVAYVIDADRLGYFPQKVQKFWADHYRWHYGSVWVAGFEISASEQGGSIDVVAPGEYRWMPSPRHRAATLEVAGLTLRAGASASLPVGPHTYSTQPAGTEGTLVLALDAPEGDEVYPFMDHVQLDRLLGIN